MLTQLLPEVTSRQVTSPISCSLDFTADIVSVVRSRTLYSFRVFAAIYGYRIVDGKHADIRCLYGKYGDGVGGTLSSVAYRIPARYIMRSEDVPAPALRPAPYGEEILYLFYGTDETGHPDWLGEIFEWLSCAHEMSLTARDRLGRIPYSHTVFGRDDVSPSRPYASLVMAWFQAFLTNREHKGTLPKAESPMTGADHTVVCTHDIDFYYVSRYQSFVRLLKNLLIAAIGTRDAAFLRATLTQLERLFGGDHVGDFLPLLTKAYDDLDIRATLFVITRAGHRRDPSYTLDRILHRLLEAANGRCSLALHGSYRSIVEFCDLCFECQRLKDDTRLMPLGSRQHWLRFDHHRKLFGSIAGAGFRYDSTLGFSSAIGFRNAASFAFPPYNFDLEEPYNLLEIPLVVMDSALASATRSCTADAIKAVDNVLQESRRLGWGGIAVLWHNPIEPLIVSAEMNQVFWNQLTNRHRYREQWVSCEDFLGDSLSRYQNAGLLTDLKLQA
jgi:hypothetical protein